ncbi:MAG: hypothetical protein ABL958_12610 [Bdellovibrionia bacterium]
MNKLKSDIERITILLGVIQVTFGCIVGFIPPVAVSWFRGIVMAHIELTANGVLMIVFGFLVSRMNLSPRLWKTWFATLQIGTWTNGLAGIIGAFSGSSSKLMTTINEKFPAPNGADSFPVTLSLQICGVTIMIALLLTIYGLLNSQMDSQKAG